jgi:hypothetical protein
MKQGRLLMPDHTDRLDTEQLAGIRGGAGAVRHPSHAADELVHAPGDLSGGAVSAAAEVGLRLDTLQLHDRTVMSDILSGAKSLIAKLDSPSTGMVDVYHANIAQQGLIADLQKDLTAGDVPQLGKYKNAPALEGLAKHVDGLAKAVNGAELTPSHVSSLLAGLKNYSTQLDAQIVKQQLQLTYIKQQYELTIETANTVKTSFNDMIRDIVRNMR